ncbi:hypothetical protein HYT25_03070 [Candidatus Pacearchaeota archaeon]|nr:hypothetical protein [Candidatus Pacearchaeota archaeon]
MESLRVYNHNNKELPFVEGVVGHHEISSYNKEIRDLVSMILLKDSEIIFVFKPPLKEEEVKGRVRIHYELSLSGKHALVPLIEFVNAGIPRQEIGDYLKTGYKILKS